MIEREVEISKFGGIYTYLSSFIFWLISIITILLSVLITIPNFPSPLTSTVDYIRYIIGIILMWGVTIVMILISKNISKFNFFFRGGTSLILPWGKEKLYRIQEKVALEIISRHIGPVSKIKEFYSFSWLSNDIVVEIGNEKAYISMDKRTFHDMTLSPSSQKYKEKIIIAMKEIRMEMDKQKDIGRR